MPFGVGGIGLSQRRRTTGPTLAMGSVIQKLEGDSGTTTFTFPVTCNGQPGTVTCDWAVVPYGSNPVVASDFVGGVLPSGSLSFGSTDALLNIVVSIQGDATAEPNEDFYVVISNPVGATIILDRGYGTIVNDDGSVSSALLLESGSYFLLEDGSKLLLEA